MAKRISGRWRIPDALWEFMSPLLPSYEPSPKGGRPRTKIRDIADGIFYVLRTGCQWNAMPREFGSSSSAHRYFQEWVAAGVFWRLWQQGLLEYDELSGIKWDWQSIDGAITKAPLGGKKNRTKPDRPREEGIEAKPAYGWRRHPTINRGVRREHP